MKAFLCLALGLAACFLPRDARAGNTNISVSSDERPSSWLNDNTEPAARKFGLDIDSSTSLGFNEDGDPSVNTRF